MDKRDYLNTLFRDTQGFIELRALGGHGRPWVEFASPGAFTQIHSFQVTATLEKHDVYVGVATRDGNAGKKENLISIPATWCDIDLKNTAKEAALKALREFPFKASMIVSSGGGDHVSISRLS